MKVREILPICPATGICMDAAHDWKELWSAWEQDNIPENLLDREVVTVQAIGGEYPELHIIVQG